MSIYFSFLLETHIKYVFLYWHITIIVLVAGCNTLVCGRNKEKIRVFLDYKSESFIYIF